MNPSKNLRQSRILQIIKQKSIETQEELVNALKDFNMDVTQATVSRDIKELGILKVATGHGKQKYVPMTQSGEGASGRLMTIFVEAVIALENTDSFVIIQTLPGMAQAAAASLDSMHLEQILGSIAGDDTIFVATRSAQDAIKLKSILFSISNIHSIPEG
ncbi:MAG: arginine repressor [Clostridiaceae bacterium]|jgi:transcriptional regulator of arginine metabolism|nr:arginine repressor [Bacillota bacterium]NLN51285.1 arginine repressor [Clostridiaceae bacterium]